MVKAPAQRAPFWELGQRIKTVRRQQNLTQQAFATQLGVTQPTVHRWEKGAFEPDPHILGVLAAAAGVSVPEFRYGGDGGVRRTIPIQFQVNGGAEVVEIGDPGHIEQVEAPPSPALATVAVRVRGDSLYPVYGDGDVLFYSRDSRARGIDAAACLGRDCVVKLAGGPVLVKRVEGGGGRGQFTLMSPNGMPMINMRLDWAAPVRWVKRR